MKTNPILIPMKMLKSPQGFDCIKTSSSQVFIPIELNDKVYNTATKLLPKMEKYSQLSGLPVVFAPKGETATLMNYGARTLYIQNQTPKDEIETQILAHINKVL